MVRNAQASSHFKRTDYEFILRSCTVKCKFSEEKNAYDDGNSQKNEFVPGAFVMWHGCFCCTWYLYRTWSCLVFLFFFLRTWSLRVSYSAYHLFPTNIIIWGSFSYINKKGFLYRGYLLNCVIQIFFSSFISLYFKICLILRIKRSSTFFLNKLLYWPLYLWVFRILPYWIIDWLFRINILFSSDGIRFVVTHTFSDFISSFQKCLNLLYFIIVYIIAFLFLAFIFLFYFHLLNAFLNLFLISVLVLVILVVQLKLILFQIVAKATLPVFILCFKFSI